MNTELIFFVSMILMLPPPRMLCIFFVNLSACEQDFENKLWLNCYEIFGKSRPF